MKECYNSIMRWKIDEIRKLKGIDFENEILDLKSELMNRNPEILDITLITVNGSVKFDGKFYDLFAQASYEITLPSSRTLEPVKIKQSLEIFETYSDSEEDLKNEEVFPVESDEISLDEAVADNILLEIPLRRLTVEEEDSVKSVQGNSWKVMSEEEYKKYQEEKKRESSPFAGLGKIFNRSLNEEADK